MSASITVRAAADGDAAPIRDLRRAAYAKWVPIIGREPLPMAAHTWRRLKTTALTCCTWTARLRA